MAKRKQPATSIAAYLEAEEIITPQHEKIIAAMKKLNQPCIMEAIAAASKMEKAQVSRRMIDLEKMDIVSKPGTTGETSAGRKAFHYILTEKGNNVAAGVEPLPPSPEVEKIKQKKVKQIVPSNQQPLNI